MLRVAAPTHIRQRLCFRALPGHAKLFGSSSSAREDPSCVSSNAKAVDSSEYSIIKEGKADILVRGNDVFYNEAQVSITITSGIRDREGDSGKFWKRMREREMNIRVIFENVGIFMSIFSINLVLKHHRSTLHILMHITGFNSHIYISFQLIGNTKWSHQGRKIKTPLLISNICSNIHARI